jgi:hypothetical protein
MWKCENVIPDHLRPVLPVPYLKTGTWRIWRPNEPSIIVDPLRSKSRYSKYVQRPIRMYRVVSHVGGRRSSGDATEQSSGKTESVTCIVLFPRRAGLILPLSAGTEDKSSDYPSGGGTVCRYVPSTFSIPLICGCKYSHTWSVHVHLAADSRWLSAFRR